MQHVWRYSSTGIRLRTFSRELGVVCFTLSFRTLDDGLQLERFPSREFWTVADYDYIVHSELYQSVVSTTWR